MADSKIEWTEQTWNPIVGCSIVSPGCTNCYAMKMANRLASNPATPAYHGTIQKSRGGPVWTGKVALNEKALLAPLKRRKPTTYFVNSMGDLFHEDVPDDWIDQVFAVMALCPQHTFQVLTKRADRMREYMAGIDNGGERLAGFRDALIEGMAQKIHHDRTGEDPSMWLAVSLPLPNVWLGVSAEDQTRADERIPALLDTPAAVRFLSCEPLLGPVDLSDRCNGHHFSNWLSGTKWHDSPGISKVERGGPALDWVIVGGESGPNARPMHPDWARSLRDQCEAAGTAFFFKQWGEWGNFTDHPEKTEKSEARIFTKYGEVLGAGKGNNGLVSESWEQSGGAWMARVGKKAAGRLLDGREWNGVPG